MAGSFVKRASYHVASVEDIMKIPDVKTAIMLLKSWSLETKGLKTKEQALQRLVDYYTAQRIGEEQQSAEKVHLYWSIVNSNIRTFTFTFSLSVFA